MIELRGSTQLEQGRKECGDLRILLIKMALPETIVGTGDMTPTREAMPQERALRETLVTSNYFIVGSVARLTFLTCFL